MTVDRIERWRRANLAARLQALGVTVNGVPAAVAGIGLEVAWLAGIHGTDPVLEMPWSAVEAMVLEREAEVAAGVGAGSV